MEKLEIIFECLGYNFPIYDIGHLLPEHYNSKYPNYVGCLYYDCGLGWLPLFSFKDRINVPFTYFGKSIDELNSKIIELRSKLKEILDENEINGKIFICDSWPTFAINFEDKRLKMTGVVYIPNLKDE